MKGVAFIQNEKLFSFTNFTIISILFQFYFTTILISKLHSFFQNNNSFTFVECNPDPTAVEKILRNTAETTIIARSTSIMYPGSVAFIILLLMF